jgi:hypothetical protein
MDDRRATAAVAEGGVPLPCSPRSRLGPHLRALRAAAEAAWADSQAADPAPLPPLAAPAPPFPPPAAEELSLRPLGPEGLLLLLPPLLE